jgi:hypothetical protein
MSTWPPLLVAVLPILNGAIIASRTPPAVNRMIGRVGIVLGVVGLAVGIGGLLLERRWNRHRSGGRTNQPPSP